MHKFTEEDVGKWFKFTNNKFAKFKKISSFENFFYFSEYITNSKHKIYDGNWYAVNVIEKLIDLSEIQQYLPGDHPDKIKIVKNTTFKKGDYVVCLEVPINPTGEENEKLGGYGYLKNRCFKINKRVHDYKTFQILFSTDFSNGVYGTSVRYATVEEIAEYNRLGKPFDVTTLSKKESVNTTSLKDQVKAGLKLKGRWLKCIKDNSWKKNIEIGEYFQIDENDSLVPYVLYKNKIEPLDLERVDLLSEFELMPEGWTPETKETIVSEVPEYVECTKSNNKDFTVGEIYTWPRPIDNDGAKRNPGVLDGSVWTFKPSTKEAYEAQKPQLNIDAVISSPIELEPVLAEIEHINDLGKSTWYEVVYFDGNWQCYAGSKTFKDGEKVIKWKYAKDCL